jgi:hypothetical protein
MEQLIEDGSELNEGIAAADGSDGGGNQRRKEDIPVVGSLKDGSNAVESTRGRVAAVSSCVAHAESTGNGRATSVAVKQAGEQASSSLPSSPPFETRNYQIAPRFQKLFSPKF